MRTDALTNNALILYFIRQGATTWPALCGRLEINPNADNTGTNLLKHALRELAEARLIQTNRL